MCKKCEAMLKLIQEVDRSKGNLLQQASDELSHSLVVQMHIKSAERMVMDPEQPESLRRDVPWAAFVYGYLFGQRIALQEDFDGATPDYEDLDSTRDAAADVIRIAGKLDDGGPGPDDKIN